MNRIKIAKILSLIASVLATGAFVILIKNAGTAADGSGNYTMIMMLGIILGIVSYCLCGFGKAVKMPFSMAKWGFLTAPFPANLLTVIVIFIFGVYAVFLLPAIPVFQAAKEKVG